MRQLVSELQAISKVALAIMNHDVNDWNLLPFKRGDIVQLKERDAESGWFRGEIHERAGWCVAAVFAWAWLGAVKGEKDMR